MPRIEVEPGVGLHVQDIGEGRPIVFLSGWAMDHEVWDATVRTFSTTHRTICIDLRGHGFSDRPAGGYTTARLAEDVGSIIEQLDLRDVALVAWSMGGQVGFQTAAILDGRISQLVLVGANAVRLTRSEQYPFGLPREQVEQMLGGELTMRPAFRRGVLAACFHSPPDDATLDWLTNTAMRTPSWAGIGCFQAMLDTDLIPEIKNVDVPVLQIHGTDDQFWPIDGARWLNGQLADARLVEIPDCGHMPFIEAADRFNAALSDFLAGSERSRP